MLVNFNQEEIITGFVVLGVRASYLSHPRRSVRDSQILYIITVSLSPLPLNLLRAIISSQKPLCRTTFIPQLLIVQNPSPSRHHQTKWRAHFKLRSTN
jgi:hypothetical protein